MQADRTAGRETSIGLQGIPAVRMLFIKENSNMKKKFIINYITCILEALAWAMAGALIVWIFQLNVSNTLKIASAIFLAVWMFVGEGIFCFIQLLGKEKNQLKVESEHAPQINLAEAEVKKTTETETNTKDIKNNINKLDDERKKVTSLVLLNEQGSVLLEWSLQNKTALIIGKSNGKDSVDIDLSGSAVADMISKQHAVLNYTDNGWYVDDIDSKNGTRVKKKYQSALLDVKLVGAVEVDPGDIIYIANAMLQIR